MKVITRALCLTLLTLLAASMEARTLRWPSVDVAARLDKDGRLHIVETQTMLFDGDWNGGERTFNTGVGEDLNFESLSRIENGQEIPLTRGSLDHVHRYAFTDKSTLRWRSRLPSDPEFVETQLIYRLRYSYSGVVRAKNDDSVFLRHDFAFANRDNSIQRYRLKLEIDRAWKTNRESSTLEFSAQNLAPGEGYVVDLPLQYLAGRPPGVPFPIPMPIRLLIGALFAGGLVYLFRRFTTRERAIGRFDPLPPVSAINDPWLRDTVFREKPEVIGAAWDDSTSSAEVAAIIARLVAEKKLSSRVEKRGFWKTDVLCLELLVDDQSLDGYERDLVQALFFGNTTTDTEAIRDHYKATGFNPLSLVQEPLKTAADALGKGSSDGIPLKRRASIVLFFLGVGLFICAGVFGTARDIAASAISGGVCIGASLFALLFSNVARRNVEHPLRAAILSQIPLLIVTAVFTAVLLLSSMPLTVFYYAGFASFLLSFFSISLNFSSTPDGRARMAVRKRLAAARRFFMDELRKPQPQLKDDWFPYLLAFGLGSRMDRWFKSFGGMTPSVAGYTGRSSGSSSSSSSSSGSGWSGGGGAFGGAGASGTWAVAAGSLAAGVSAPSSSSSGGGGGGSSSGGGGGGGW